MERQSDNKLISVPSDYLNGASFNSTSQTTRKKTQSAEKEHKTATCRNFKVNTALNV